MKKIVITLFALVCLGHVATSSAAQGFRERLAAARAASVQPGKIPSVPAGTRVLRDVSYGIDPRQTFDVYLPAVTKDAPVMLFVHGGGWVNGNKDNPGIVENKAAYWLPKGYVLVSTNYRMRPDAAPLDQARDVARALAEVQKHAPQWNVNPAQVTLMGHSAGAHLAVLVGASNKLWRAAGAVRPLGVVSLDSGALDVPLTMARPPLPGIYERAFGDNQADWIAASPFHQLTADAPPMLIVCSSRRRDVCAQSEAFKQKASTLGVRVEVLQQDLTHGEINRDLGKPSAYTRAVDAFLQSVKK
ncbi:MAG TPA: alpha/beta hydrolase [Pseudoxanthomonas sp.]|nr:alpha/beta hydrolase [Pseudoxanthomonas sp.]